MALGIQVVFDCADPATLSSFWAEALGYIVQPPPPGFDSWEAFVRANGWPEEELGRASAIVDPEGGGPRIFFQRVPEGKAVKNRVHLDVNASAGSAPGDAKGVVREAAERLKGLGAVELCEKDERSGHWITMQDPEGNEFCVQ
jgi:Glyoxalase-like domain